MAENLKQKTISAMLWSTLGKFGTLSIQFIANMVLARLLMPEDYGCIGMLLIFMVISEVLITGGFGQALIQKKNPTHLDYTTVFYWNLVASVIIYFLLYVVSPFISEFYNMSQLCDILRVYSLTLIISSFSIVQNNLLQKQLKFKSLTIRNVISTSCGTIIAIIMAFNGFGVWSLVASAIINSITSVCLLWKMSSWRPTWDFSWKSFKELFSFGSLMAFSSLVDEFYKEMQGLIIGKFYSASSLGYYTQAKKLENIPVSSLSQIVSQVTFPVFSKLQDDKALLKRAVKKCIVSLTYLNFPMCVLLIVIASPLIKLLYGSQWLPAIPYFQLLCVSGLMYTIMTMNNTIIKSLGKSNIFLYVRLIQRFIGLIIIAIGASYSIIGLLIGVIISNIISYFITTVVNMKLIKYGFIEQIQDIIKNLLLSVVIGLVTYSIDIMVTLNEFIVMFLQIITYIGLYALCSKTLKITGYKVFEEVVKSKISKNK